MGKAIKKQITINFQELTFNTKVRDDIINWVNFEAKFIGGTGQKQCYASIGPDGGVYIHTLEGKMYACTGDFIIQGVEGEFYPCKPDIFHKTYDIIS